MNVKGRAHRFFYSLSLNTAKYKPYIASKQYTVLNVLETRILVVMLILWDTQNESSTGQVTPDQNETY